MKSYLILYFHVFYKFLNAFLRFEIFNRFKKMKFKI